MTIMLQTMHIGLELAYFAASYSFYKFYRYLKSTAVQRVWRAQFSFKATGFIVLMIFLMRSLSRPSFCSIVSNEWRSSVNSNSSG